LKFRNN